MFPNLFENDPRKTPRLMQRSKGGKNVRKSDPEYDYGPEGHKHCRSGKPRRGSWLDAKLRAGGNDLSDRLQDLEDSARSDEAGAPLLFPDAGRKGQPRLWRTR